MSGVKGIISNLKKFRVTLNNFKKTAYHHYGDSPLSYFKFIYYSGLRINTFIVYENDLARELPPHDLDSEFEVIKPSLEELRNIRIGKNLPREFYYDQLLNASTCYLAFCEGELAYIHWLFFKGDHSRFLILSDGVAELNYNTTLPGFKGRRLSAKMMAYISKDLQNSGYSKVMGIIHERNIASIKCILLAGFRETGRIKALGPLHRKMKI